MRSPTPISTPDSFHGRVYGGSWCFLEPIHRTGVAYVMNCCVVAIEFVDRRQHRIWKTCPAVLEKLNA